MSGFDPRKYHGRRLDEVVRSVNGDIRSVLEEAHAAYRFCLRQENLPAHRKGWVRMQLWQVEKQLGLHSQYFSQAGQDRYLNERIFRNKRNGAFVEIGGYDGWTGSLGGQVKTGHLWTAGHTGRIWVSTEAGSNCVFFEKVLGWTGLVVEASPQLVKRIGETRSAKVIHVAVSDREGAAEFFEVASGLTQMGGLIDHYHAETLQRVRRDERHSEIAVTVPSTRLDTLLRAHGLETIDYCSIDVEGAERAVLGSLDFDAFDITALSIENSRPGRESYDDIMDPAGYRQVAVLGFDEIWVRQSVLSQDPPR